MKGKIILGSLIVLFIALAIPNVTATYDVCTGCHPSYVNAIRASGHANSDFCLDCHKGGYDTSDHQDSTPYIGYNVTEATCNQPYCHSATSGIGQRPVNESHGNKYYGPTGKADCTQCHFANTTRTFTGYNTSLYTHDHNLIVEYNFYNYNLSGMPLSTNGGVGKGMFPYYTCTLTCHSTYKIEDEVIGWNQSKHAQSRVGTADSNAYCAKCKSPTQYNTSADTTYNASASRSDFPIAESNWQGIQCRICHNIHNDTYSGISAPAFPLAYYNPVLSYNASRPIYDQVSNATVLCEKCHSGSNSRQFAGFHKDTLGFDCANCHANSTFSNLTHKFEVKNTTSGVEGCEVCHAAADHTWEQTSKHTNVDCWACHDQTVVYNSTSGNATSPGNTFGIWNDSTTGNWTTYKLSHGAPASWVLHNITKSVSCDKCHMANSTFNGTIGPGLTCSGCHTSYASAVNSSKHNQTLYPGAPACTDCHAGYVPSYGHTTGANGYIVNESNTCNLCHAPSGSAPVNESHGNYRHGPNYADCTQCHFANTTQTFTGYNTSLYTHDHNLTVEYNFYNYNLSGMPLSTNGGVGKGMFPYYTCTLTCHSTYKIEDEVIGWNQSKHARSYEGAGDNNAYCAKCKSPTQYNLSAAYANRTSYTIDPSNWQGIQCRICHNLHNDTYSGNGTPPVYIAFYNTTATLLTGNVTYDSVPNATILCQNCHYNRNFAGVHKDTVGFDCANCHANKTLSNYNHTFEVKNTTSNVEGCAVCHNSADHIWQYTSLHISKMDCWACHDQTVVYNTTSGNATSPGNTFGIWKDPSTGNWTTYKVSHGAPAAWVLHNITKSVNCDKCHIGNSTYNGTIGPALTCTECHSSYASAVNSSKHNQTLYSGAPTCTGCHTGYQPSYGHTTGNRSYIVNGSNTCQTSGCHDSVQKNMGGRNGDIADCTDCHFANTTQPFNWNTSLPIHDHNLTVEYNFYNYNISGMPLSTNNGTGKGMFPYYTCTLTCHDNSDSQHLSIEDKVIGWSQSKHAQSREGDATYDSNAYCAKCKSPPNYNLSAGYGNRTSYSINASDWQGIQCRICHNLHNDTYSGNGTPPVYIAFYNATATLQTGNVTYDTVPNATVLCENCHTGSSHDSKYGGFHKDTLKFDCADCHMNSTFGNATHMFEVKNTTSGVTGCEVCHDKTSAHTNFIEFSIHGNVTCEACHDKTVARNSSDFVVNVSAGMDAGLYKDTSTNKWATYKASHGSPATWPLHNISKSIDCNKCHGARSVYSGAIAPNLTSGGTSYYTTDTLVSGYNLILLLLNPNPTLYAGNLLYTSPIGIPGVTKVLKWDSTNQTWVSYQYIVPSNGVGFYYGTNSTMDGYKAYFIKGNATTAGKTYTFVGTK